MENLNELNEELQNQDTPSENVEETVETVMEVAEEAVEETQEEQDVLVNGVMSEKDIDEVSRKQKVTSVLVQVGLYTFLGIMALVVVFPFYWMLISSVKTLNEYYWTKPSLWPETFDWVNYVEAFNTANLGTLFVNTVLVGVVSTLISLVITILSAFAFARLEFKGKDAVFGFLLATMMIPGELFTITNYQTVNKLDWLNTYTVLIVPFLVSVFYIYLLKQNFMQIPNELYLAAKVDGTTDFKYLLKVMIPLSLPTLISITILKMMGAWNTYAWPRLVTTNPEMYLITIGLRDAFAVIDGKPDFPVQMAAVTMVSIPLFMVFIFLRKYIMKGVSRSGIKG
jgi:multiple sugar transport system permease protein